MDVFLGYFYHSACTAVTCPTCSTISFQSRDADSLNRFYCLVSIHNVLCQMKKDRDTRTNSRALACSAAPTRILMLHNPPVDTEAVVVFLVGRWRSSHKDQSVWLLRLARLFQTFSPNVHFPFIFSALQSISILFPRAVSVHTPNRCSSK